MHPPLHYEKVEFNSLNKTTNVEWKNEWRAIRRCYKITIRVHMKQPRAALSVCSCVLIIFMSVFINDIMNFLVGRGVPLICFLRVYEFISLNWFFFHDLLLLCTIIIVNEWSTCMWVPPGFFNEELFSKRDTCTSKTLSLTTAVRWYFFRFRDVQFSCCSFALLLPPMGWKLKKGASTCLIITQYGTSVVNHLLYVFRSTKAWRQIQFKALNRF